jgi:hypothetical protein
MDQPLLPCLSKSHHHNSQPCPNQEGSQAKSSRLSPKNIVRWDGENFHQPFSGRTVKTTGNSGPRQGLLLQRLTCENILNLIQASCSTWFLLTCRITLNELLKIFFISRTVGEVLSTLKLSEDCISSRKSGISSIDAPLVDAAFCILFAVTTQRQRYFCPTRLSNQFAHSLAPPSPFPRTESKSSPLLHVRYRGRRTPKIKKSRVSNLQSPCAP